MYARWNSIRINAREIHCNVIIEGKSKRFNPVKAKRLSVKIRIIIQLDDVLFFYYDSELIS